MSNPQRRDEVEHDLLFTEASRFGNYIYTSRLYHKPLHPPWNAFQHTLDSVKIMAILPQLVANTAVSMQLLIAQATYNVLKKPVMSDTDLRRGAGSAIEHELLHGMPERFFDDKKDVIEFLTKNLVHHNKRTLVNSSLFKAGYFAMLESQVVAVWTAFDAFTTDLCVAVANAKPGLLEKLGSKQVTLKEILQRVGTDWSNPGEFLKAFVRFDSFQGTQDAYKKVFSDAKISAIISCDAAAIACLIRNQIIHDSSLVTSNFIRQATELKADPWQSFALGTRLPLDGKNVAELCEGLVQCANELILAVDSWLQLPPDQPAA